MILILTYSLIAALVIINAALFAYCYYSPITYLRNKSNMLILETTFPKLTFNYGFLARKTLDNMEPVTMDDFKLNKFGELLSLHFAVLSIIINVKQFYIIMYPQSGECSIGRNKQHGS